MKSIKKILLIVVIAMMGTGFASAQLRFGIKAGLNVNKLHFDESLFDGENGCGYTAGVMTEFTVPIIGLCFDASLMYTHMQSKDDVSVSNINRIAPRFQQSVGDVTAISKNKDFFEIPINVKYKFQIPVVAAIIKPYLFTGPSFAIKLDKGNDKALIQTKRLQTVWNVGLGVELIRHLQVGASYGFGMNNIVKDSSVASDADIKNNYWTVTAAWLF